MASALSKIGYDPTVVETGGQGFTSAASSADFEVILMDPSQLQGTYNATATVVNLRADSRTAGIPIFLYGPLANRDRLSSLLNDYSRVGFLVTPIDPGQTKRQLDKGLADFGARPMTVAERDGFSRAAAAYLAQLGTQPNSPFTADLRRVQSSLTRAMTGAVSASGASTALGDVPGVDAQRVLAEAFLDSSRTPALRYDAGKALARSIQKFGPLLTNEQETKLAEGLGTEADPTLRGVLASIVGALRPPPAQVGQRLLALPPAGTAGAAAPPAPPTAAEPRPEVEPRPAPEPKPEAEAKPAEAKPDPGEGR